MVDFFFVSFSALSPLLITKGLDKESLSPPNAYTIYTVCTTFAFLKSCEVLGWERKEGSKSYRKVEF